MDSNIFEADFEEEFGLKKKYCLCAYGLYIVAPIKVLQLCLSFE